MEMHRETFEIAINELLKYYEKDHKVIAIESGYIMSLREILKASLDGEEIDVREY